MKRASVVRKRICPVMLPRATVDGTTSLAELLGLLLGPNNGFVYGNGPHLV